MVDLEEWDMSYNTLKLLYSSWWMQYYIMVMLACPWMRRAVPVGSGASGAVGCMYGSANVFNTSGGVFFSLFK